MACGGTDYQQGIAGQTACEPKPIFILWQGMGFRPNEDISRLS